ncbi:MAG: hypothetical protein WC359_14600 [Dehalococcoidia bacterium]
MAKREIKREIERVEEQDGKSEEQETALPAENKACPMEVEPVDVTVTVSKRPAVVAIRVLRGMLFYNDGYKMNRVKLNPAKPVTVRIEQ